MQVHDSHIIIIACTVLALLLGWLEYRRASKRFVWLRVLAVIVAAVSLACIALPITYTGRQEISAVNTIALLTDGFNKDSIPAGTEAYTSDEAVKKDYPKAKLISSPTDIDSTKQLHIYGYGLAKTILELLDERSIIFHPAEVKDGIVNADWNRQLKAGGALTVQGVYKNASSKKVKLVLRGLNTALASAVIEPKATSGFELKTYPKATGRLVYEVLSVTNGHITQIGSVPFEVEEVKPLSILMLTASPDFETRFLKNWLTQKGYSVALRSAISKGKFNTEFINIPQLNLATLSASALNKFDVVMGDLSVLSGLSPTEGAALKQAVTNDGLGVIVKADSTGKTSWLQSAFPVDRSATKEPLPSTLMIDGQTSKAKNLSSSAATISYREGTQVIVKNRQGKTFAAVDIAGGGKLVFTTLNNTYRWTLAGNKDDYANFWTTLISKAAKKQVKTDATLAVTGLPVVNEPADLVISSSAKPGISMDGQLLAITQDISLPFRWSVRYWPAKTGWQTLNVNGKAKWWYAYKPDEWLQMQSAQKLRATSNYAAQHQPKSIVTKQIQQKVQIAVPKLYFYILLLAACIFLWVEAKFS